MNMKPKKYLKWFFFIIIVVFIKLKYWYLAKLTTPGTSVTAKVIKKILLNEDAW